MIQNYLRYCGYVHPEELGEDGERVNKDFLMLFFSDTGLHILQQATDIFIGKLLYNLKVLVYSVSGSVTDPDATDSHVFGVRNPYELLLKDPDQVLDPDPD